MGVKSSLRLTVQERILLHLNEFSKYIDQIEVPFDLTQEGIAQSVGVVRSAIPRAMKKLIVKRNINEKLAHVLGLSRRRKVYYLTTEGIMNAMDIKEKLSSMKIQVILKNNQVKKCQVKDVPELINQKIPILDIILNLDSDNNFKINDYKKIKAETGSIDTSSNKTIEVPEIKEPAFLSDRTLESTIPLGTKKIIEINDKKYYIDKAPKIPYFFGRKEELKKINNNINRPDCKIIIVYGMAGIGKTTLAVKLLDNLYDDFSLFWYRFHEWDTLRNVLTSISKFLEHFNRVHLKNYLTSNQNIDLNEVADILEIDFKGLNGVLFFDDFHKINEQVIGLFTLIREILERISGINLLIFSRSIVPFYDRREVLIKHLIYELELTGLNENDSKELLEFRNIKIDNFTQIYALTQGHPLSLELLEPKMDLKNQKNIMMYLEEEVLSRLSIREKSLLKIASVFRYPVPADGFFIFEKAQIGRETLSILTKKSLIKGSDEGYEVHDLIRDFFYSYLTTHEQYSYHKKIGQFYMNRLKMINDLLKKKISTDLLPRILINAGEKDNYLKNELVDKLIEQRARGILEAQYHFLMAKDYNRAAEVAIIMGHELFQESYIEGLFDNLNKIDLTKVSDEYSMDLKILKADVLNSLGDYENALDFYQQSIELARQDGNETKLAELYCKLGLIKEKLNDYKSAIEFLNKSLKISKKIGDAKSISDAYGGLGGIYWKMSDFNKSNAFYNKCFKSAEAISDLPGKAKTFLSLGILSAKRGQFEESIKYYEKCLDILDKGKSLDGINYKSFYENLEDHYLKTIFSYYIQSNSNNKKIASQKKL